VKIRLDRFCGPIFLLADGGSEMIDLRDTGHDIGDAQR
jgi:hypothetical protein